MSVHKEKAAAQRYTIELSSEYQEAVADLIKATGLRTQKDVFESSIALLSWAVREVGRGRVIASFDETTKTFAEIHMPALMQAARRAA